MITLAQLCKICPLAKSSRLAPFIDPLNTTFDEFEINTPVREAAFLAQIAHESGSFRYVKELASGQDYDVGEKAKRLGNTPEDDDDGERYKGRGLIQVTGTTNYRACGTALGLDLLGNPGLLEEPIHAARSAGWFWQSRGLNEIADRGDFRLLTKRINGGYNGLDDRVEYWERAKKVLV